MNIRRFSLLKDRIYRDLLFHSGIAFGFRIIGVVLGFYFSIVVSRNLGASGFGIVSLFIATLMPLSAFSRLGLDSLFIKQVAVFNVKGDTEKRNECYRAIFLTIVLMTMALALFINLLLPSDGDFVGIPFFLVISLPFHALFFLNLQTLKASKLISFSSYFENVSVWLISLCLFWVLPKEKLNVDLLLVVYFFAIVLSYITSQVVCSGKMRMALKWPKECFIFVKYIQLQEAWPLYITALITIAMPAIDVWILKTFLDNTAVGIYSVAVKVTILMTFPLTAIIAVVAPKFSEAYSKNNITLLRDLYVKSTRLSFLAGLPIFLLIIFFPCWVLSLFGPEFVSGKNIIIVLAFGQLVNIAAGPIGFLLLMTNKAGKLQSVMVVSLCLSIVLSLILVPLYGAVGVAIAGAITLIYKNLTCWFYVKKKYGISY